MASGFLNRQIKNAAGKVADRNRAVEARLPVDRWIQGPGFVFGLPFGWVDFPEEEVLDIALRSPNQQRPLAAVRADRSDQPYHHLMVQLTQNRLRESEFRSLVPQLAANWAKNMAPARIIAGPQRIAVAGAPAMRFEAQEIMDGQQYGFAHAVVASTTFVLACRRSRTYSVELVGRADQHEAYLPSLETALGTWQWA